MGHAPTKGKRRLVCPGCNASVTVHGSSRPFSTCPHCGEWLADRARWSHRPDSDFDGSPDWEHSPIDETKSSFRTWEGRWHR